MDPNLIIDATYDWENDLPPSDEMKRKQRYIYMRDVFSKIDKTKIDNLKRLSRQEYDEIDFDRPFDLDDYLCKAEPMDE